MEENRTVLILDDEAEALKGYESFLSGGESSSGDARKTSRGAKTPEKAGVAAGGESYRILKASTGEEAIEIAKKETAEGRNIAAGFFDVKLGPGIDGIQTIQEIKKIDPQIHCVVVTAYHDRTVDEMDKIFGEDFKDQWDYLNKPFTRGEIVQKARQMVAAWNRKRQIELMNKQLIESERMAAIGQVARGIGHEFGNILLRIMGKADLAVRESDIDKVKKHLEVVLTASERASVIVRNLQSFSRTKPAMKLVAISEPVEESLSLLSHELVKKSVELVKDIKTVPETRMDPGSIAQVVLNICINAVHSMGSKGGGKLTVTVEEGKGPQGEPGVECRIKDTGTGIPDDILDKIFEYAFTTKGSSGSGLGLSLSKNIVSNHGGTLDVTTKEGEGSEFRIWLPMNLGE